VKSVEVRSGQYRYEALIGSGLLAEIGPLVRRRFPGDDRCAVVSDTNVAPLLGAKVCDSLRGAGFRPQLIAIAAGEGAKSIAQVGALCDQLGAAGLDRSSFLVSLGGGVLGDLAGFIASIYMRGVPYVAVPTTLLAQVDSCIGGKTGVNSSAGKNLIGSFHHPALVIADIDTLQTLPDRIWHEGFAEVIKHGIIRDAELFTMAAQACDWQRNDDASWELARPKLALLVERSLAIKAAIVAADEREQNDIRALLNFGHTLGHAIEFAAGSGELLHGEALSLGMVAAAHVSMRRAGLASRDADQISAALQAHHLPIALTSDFPRMEIFDALPLDKKFVNGRIRFVVAHGIGQASVAEGITMEDLRAAVDAL
jgi:3-dehydroquinate synthase